MSNEAPHSLPLCAKCGRRRMRREVVQPGGGVTTGIHCGCDWPWPDVTEDWRAVPATVLEQSQRALYHDADEDTQPEAPHPLVYNGNGHEVIDRAALNAFEEQRLLQQSIANATPEQAEAIREIMLGKTNKGEGHGE